MLFLYSEEANEYFYESFKKDSFLINYIDKFRQYNLTVKDFIELKSYQIDGIKTIHVKMQSI